MGQAFWCRGPSLATKFTASDFPTLQPHSAYQDDHASVLQSQLDLTVLFGNIHDILYASKPTSVGLMLRGGYTKYLDDSMQGLAAWKQSWNSLSISQHLKLMLELQYEYLRLYVHGFAFQAAISRPPDTTSNSEQHPTLRFINGLLATPDGRHIRLAIDAAKSALEILGNHMNPTMHLRFLGPRYYLYAIHCAVFLFKSASHGAIGPGEERECATMVDRYVDNLKMAAPCERHIASRHSVLLMGLWHRDRSAPIMTESIMELQADSSYRAQQTRASLTNALLDSDVLHDQESRNEVLGKPGTFPEPRKPILSTALPESLVTGLYDSDDYITDQQYGNSDISDFLNFGTYGEPDLRYLISLPYS